MIAISSLLSKEKVVLDPEVRSPREAVEAVSALLRTDRAVVSWEKLMAGLAVGERAPCAALRGCDFGVCIPHVRTDAVTGMVMSFGRFREGLIFSECPTPVLYMFCIGLPPALNADYLGVVGLLTRFLRSPAHEQILRVATRAEEVVSALVRFQKAC
jgi:mannitol/fructose-specific phosphotransferase system IIA component (Ntr-type)